MDFGNGFDSDSFNAWIMICIKAVIKSFDNKKVIKNISTTFEEGKTNLIIGRTEFGVRSKNSLLIDNLIHELTVEYNMTTIINTHDMNSVMNIGEKVIFIHKRKKEWEEGKEGIMNSSNKELNDFVFISYFFEKYKRCEKFYIWSTG